MALIVEAAEVVEQLSGRSRFATRNCRPDKRAAIGAELADVLFYLVRLADRLDINLGATAADKLAATPPAITRRHARQYDEYDR